MKSPQFINAIGKELVFFFSTIFYFIPKEYDANIKVEKNPIAQTICNIARIKQNITLHITTCKESVETRKYDRYIQV